ncbi:hypothetical protein B0H13DRAFT_1972961, partial [Mycena leptocephala]
MTRSASPNGAVEFSYDFPVAGPSRLPSTPRTQRTHTHTRQRSPTRPRWESTVPSYDDEDDNDDDIDYDAAVRLITAPSAYAPYSAPLLLAPPSAASYPISSSVESERSILSSCARSCHSTKEKPHREHAKIRKARRSVDSESPLPLPSVFAPSSGTSSQPSSANSSPYFSTYDDFDAASSSSHDDFDAEERDRDPQLEGEEELEGEDKENAAGHAPSSLRRQWAALSLR